MMRRKKCLLIVIAAIVILALAWTMWDISQRGAQRTGSVLFRGELKTGSQRLGPIIIPPDVKSITVILRGYAYVSLGYKISMRDDSGQEVLGGSGARAHRARGLFGLFPGSFEIPLAENCETLLAGTYSLAYNVTVTSPDKVEMVIVVSERQPPGFKPIESLEDAQARLEQGRDSRAMAYVQRLWRLHGQEPEWAERLTNPGRQSVTCRKVLKLGGPAVVHMTGVNGLQSDWNTSLRWDIGVILDGSQKIMFQSYVVDVSGQQGGDIRSYLTRPGKHSMQAYIKLTCTKGGPAHDVNWTREWLGSSAETDVVEQLPEGTIRAISNPQMDEEMRSCFEIDAAHAWPKGSHILWLLKITKPLPVALACRLYVSVDGEEPVPVHENSFGGRTASSCFFYRPARTAPKDFLAGDVHLRCGRILNRPGKHTVRWILRPDPDSALLGIDCADYWGGEYQTSVLEYEYVPEEAAQGDPRAQY